MPRGNEYPARDIDFDRAALGTGYAGSVINCEVSPLYSMGRVKPAPLRLRSRREPSRGMNEACRSHNASRVAFADASGAICLADKMTDRSARRHPSYNSFSGADIVSSFKE